jgi:hypothetical protein
MHAGPLFLFAVFSCNGAVSRALTAGIHKMMRAAGVGTKKPKVEFISEGFVRRGE